MEGGDSIKKVGITLILIVLIILSYFLLKPILTSILFGAVLAFIFFPLYKRLAKLIKSRNLSATLICLLFIAIIVIPLWFLTPILLNQSINIFMGAQDIDFVTPLKKIVPSLFASPQFSNEIGSILSSFTNKITSSIMGEISNLLINFPILALQLIVVFFVFFFVMRDSDEIIEYLQSILPFPKETEQKLFKSSKEVTFSVLYGVILIGIVQGLVASAGYFLFGVKNPLFLTILTIIAGILPIIGTSFIWIPVAIYLLITDSPILPILGVSFFGILSVIIDDILRPIVIAKRAKVHSVIVLVGMIGGTLLLGIIGVIIGPLILSYLIIILEIYKNKRIN